MPQQIAGWTIFAIGVATILLALYTGVSKGVDDSKTFLVVVFAGVGFLWVTFGTAMLANTDEGA